MPLAVTHVLIAIILIDIYRDYFADHKKYFSMFTLLIAGIAGLLPDIDIPLTWLLNLFGLSIDFLKHGGITHTPFFGLIFLIPAFIYLKKEQHKKSMYFFVVTFGILLHISLDFILGGGDVHGIILFWPFSASTFKLHLLSKLGIDMLPAAIDAVILLLWLWHEEAKHKINDFF